jgi:hypothetical protein
MMMDEWVLPARFLGLIHLMWSISAMPPRSCTFSLANLMYRGLLGLDTGNVMGMQCTTIG